MKPSQKANRNTKIDKMIGRSESDKNKDEKKHKDMHIIVGHFDGRDFVSDNKPVLDNRAQSVKQKKGVLEKEG